MAKQKRKQAPAKPITSHQLFPAVVALWFGALFGLGSLAVRPSLLESLVRSSRIDLIVPAAAPPLGVTARMLMALILAAIGAGIGIAIARRLARPKLEPRERKRNARSVDASEFKPRYAQPEVAARRSNPVYDQNPDSDAGTGVLAQRRRALTVEHVEEDFVPHDMAPLPGGTPQILDIGSMTISPEAAEAPLDLSAYQQAQPVPAPVQEFVPVANPVQLDWNQAAPVMPAAPVQSQPPVQEFHQPAPPVQAAPMPVAHELPVAAQAEPVDNRQVFGIAPSQPPVETPRQIFGQAIQGDHIDPEFVRSAGFKASVFETDEVEPLFVQRAETAQPQIAEPLAPAMPQAFEVPPAPPLPQFEVPSAEIPAPVAAFEPAAPAMPEPQPIAAPEPAPVAQQAPAPLPPLPSPAGLGMTDLASRLAESMARRRAARSGQAYVPPAEEPAPQAFAPAPAPIAAEPEPAPVPAAFEPAPELAADPLPQAFAPVIEAAPAPAPQAFTPVAPVAPIQFAAEMPARLESEPAAPFSAPAQAPAIPQAMRPLDLSGFEDDDNPFDSLLPPRHIAMPSPVPAAFQPVAVEAPAFAQPEAAPAPSFSEPVEEAEVTHAEVAEENYASLASISTPRSGFVRIEEPAADFAAVEPVVIFPGQAPRAAFEDDQASLRRFDAPAAAGQHAQPVAPNQQNPDVDREEADRALRAALANLQRMSGAA